MRNIFACIADLFSKRKKSEEKRLKDNAEPYYEPEYVLTADMVASEPGSIVDMKV